MNSSSARCRRCRRQSPCPPGLPLSLPPPNTSCSPDREVWRTGATAMGPGRQRGACGGACCGCWLSNGRPGPRPSLAMPCGALGLWQAWAGGQLRDRSARSSVVQGCAATIWELVGLTSSWSRAEGGLAGDKCQLRRRRQAARLALGARSVLQLSSESACTGQTGPSPASYRGACHTYHRHAVGLLCKSGDRPRRRRRSALAAAGRPSEPSCPAQPGAPQTHAPLFWSRSFPCAPTANGFGQLLPPPSSFKLPASPSACSRCHATLDELPSQPDSRQAASVPRERLRRRREPPQPVQPHQVRGSAAPARPTAAS